MPKITLQPSEERLIQTSGLFLSILDADGGFKLENPKIGVISGSAGRQYQIKDISEMLFVNSGVSAVNIEYEVANIVITSVGKGAVTVSNEIVVKRIVEAINVTATSTVEDGKMAKNVANNFAPIAIAKTSIAAGATVEVIAARAALNRTAIIQLITDSPNMAEIRLGSSALNAAVNQGIFLQGNKDAVSAYEWETETAIFIHNPTAAAVTIAGGETWRA
ncbi:MAG: hypothetical protein COB83_08030 [Gammaproteobacteria bacterium]|nr:MAG: hypothetical protein COB83_08030 [Gammaproteobacteria bacterium]